MIRYPHLIAFRTNAPIADAIADLAVREHLSPADTCRRLIIAGLRQHGIEPARPTRPPVDQVAS
jgi:hypothetical protein